VIRHGFRLDIRQVILLVNRIENGIISLKKFRSLKV
jgi:hypothetical protein